MTIAWLVADYLLLHNPLSGWLEELDYTILNPDCI